LNVGVSVNSLSFGGHGVLTAPLALSDVAAVVLNGTHRTARFDLNDVVPTLFVPSQTFICSSFSSLQYLNFNEILNIFLKILDVLYLF